MKLRIGIYLILLGIIILTTEYIVNQLYITKNVVNNLYNPNKKIIEAKLVFAIDKGDHVILLCEGIDGNPYTFYLDGYEKYSILYYLRIGDTYEFEVNVKDGKMSVLKHPKGSQILKI